VAASGSHTCALDSAGVAYCWGNNADGALGNGTRRSSLVPTRVVMPTEAAVGGFSRLVVGEKSTCATVRSSKRIYCWGTGWNPTRPSGSPVSRPTPLPSVGSLAGLTAVRVEVSTDFPETCALAADGSVHCWADNQLPIQVAGLPTPASAPVVSLSVGTEVACAVVRGGQAFCWRTVVEARNPPALGDGTRYWGIPEPPAYQAVPVKSSATLTSIVTDSWTTCAVTTSKTVLCWGMGANGELGNGAFKDRYLPGSARVPHGRLVTTLASTGTGFCATDTLAVVWCWGANYEGELGRGTKPMISATPAPVLSR